MPRILITDTYYAEALDALHRTHPGWRDFPYSAHLCAIMDQMFGTADFYSSNLSALGWEAIDAITNADALQAKWAADHRVLFGIPEPTRLEIALAQVRRAAPDVLFLQDASLFGHATLRDLKRRGILLASQISCPMPPEENVRCMDVVFTSFPHYVERLRALGVRRVEYSPLAFDPRVLERMPQALPRDLPITFVGGVGADLHWRRGTATLEAVAKAYPAEFRWWGYGLERLTEESPLRACYRGEAWGREMYSVLLRSRLVVNRHGEVAQGNANCMRLYEATGCGACVLTEDAKNIGELFPPGSVALYEDAESLVARIGRLIEDEPVREGYATAGRRHTMEHHTYARKMETVDRVLREELANPARKKGAA